MMISIGSYVRQGRHRLRKWALDPRMHLLARAAGHILSGFLFSAASLAGRAMPLAMGAVLAETGWRAVLTALGGVCGYLLFWGRAGRQGVLWAGMALAATLVPGQRMDRQTRLLLSALGALITSAAGVAFQFWMEDTTPVPVYILRVALGVGSTALLLRVSRERNPILDWLTCCAAVLALAQVAPVPALGLGYLAAGVLSAAGAFPAAALAGLALDLAQITRVPMTAVLCGSFLVRFLGDSLGGKSKIELANKAFSTPADLAQAGVDISIITDAPVIPLHHLPMCAGLAANAGLGYEAAWRAITINPARALEIADRVGSLEVGKDADVVIWTADPIKSVGAEAFVTIVDGKIAYQQ